MSLQITFDLTAITEADFASLVARRFSRAASRIARVLLRYDDIAAAIFRHTRSSRHLY